MTRSPSRALPLITRHVLRATPWGTLAAGCLTGTAALAVLAYVTHRAHGSLDQGSVRLAFLPALAALAFVPRSPFRPLLGVTPVPAWLTTTGQVLLAVPVLVLTGWAQLLIVGYRSTPPGITRHPPALYPLIAQLIGWCALTVAVAACCDWSRYADLGGAIAAPVSLAVLAVLWFVPATNHTLFSPPAGPHIVTTAWYGVALAALVLTCAAVRDRWSRYTRPLTRRLLPAAPAARKQRHPDQRH